jgi:hypothetical protein
MYITIFDSLAESLALLHRLPRWKNLPPPTRASIAGVIIIAVTIVLGVFAIFKSPFVALIPLGVFYGIVSSKILSQFLAPRIQTSVVSFLSGITLGNIGVQQAKVSAAIHNIANWVQQVADDIARQTHTQDAFSDAVVWAIWTALLTATVILAANAYYASQDSNTVGNERPVAIHSAEPVAAH